MVNFVWVQKQGHGQGLAICAFVITEVDCTVHVCIAWCIMSVIVCIGGGGGAFLGVGGWVKKETPVRRL